MKKIQSVITIMAIAVGILLPVAPALAIDIPGCSNASAGSSICTQVKNGGVETPNRIKNIINLLLYVIGIIAVIVIIVGGIRYVTSGGDSNQVSGAKDTILYAVVGLVVAIMAYSIVNFVLGNF